jgi:hypothetical protein
MPTWWKTWLGCIVKRVWLEFLNHFLFKFEMTLWRWNVSHEILHNF